MLQTINRTVILLLLFAPSAYCQQGNNWNFGSLAGITFNASLPMALLNGAMLTSEGCASMSDNNGNLLFYTDGSKVWNRIHQVMPNGTGLKGGISSSNSAIIIPLESIRLHDEDTRRRMGSQAEWSGSTFRNLCLDA